MEKCKHLRMSFQRECILNEIKLHIEQLYIYMVSFLKNKKTWQTRSRNEFLHMNDDE